MTPMRIDWGGLSLGLPVYHITTPFLYEAWHCDRYESGIEGQMSTVYTYIYIYISHPHLFGPLPLKVLRIICLGISAVCDDFDPYLQFVWSQTLVQTQDIRSKISMDFKLPGIWTFSDHFGDQIL